MRHSVALRRRIAGSGWLERVPGETVLVALVLLAGAAGFLLAHHIYPLTPKSASFDSGWWVWTDQSRYYRAARAWAAGDLRASQHWYLPGYPLLGALFVAVMPAEPFLVPDLVCLVLTGALMAALAGRLAAGLPYARLLGAVAFLVTCILSRDGLKSWIEPWTSTPLAVVVLGTLLAALRFGDRPGVGRGFACGLLWGAIVMVRPTEAVAAGVPAALFCLATLLRSGLAPGRATGVALAGVAGALLPLLATLGIHLTLFGWALGHYLAESLGTGFEWRLLPLRWVTLVVAPWPLHAGGNGIGVQFRWVLPGFAGLLTCMFADRGRRGPHWLVGVAVMLHWMLYLTYRDLHPEGLWKYGNYHYFKWTEPVLALYAVLLLRLAVLRRTRLAAAGGVCVVAFTCLWRAELTPLPAGEQDAREEGAHVIVLPSGLTQVSDAVFAAATGSFEGIYIGPDIVTVGGRRIFYNGDIKAYPVAGGMVVAPLRPFAPGAVRIETAPEVTLDPGVPPILVRRHLVFGLPCPLQKHAAACQPFNTRAGG